MPESWNSLKALDPNRPIREADIGLRNAATRDSTRTIPAQPPQPGGRPRLLTGIALRLSMRAICRRPLQILSSLLRVPLEYGLSLWPSTGNQSKPWPTCALKAARDRKKAETGKCGGRKSYAEAR